MKIRKLTFVVATAAAVVLSFCCMPFAVQAQSNPSSDTIQLITGGGKATLQTAEGRSNSTCTTTSTDHAVAVAVGGRCSSFGTSADLPEHFYVKIVGDALTFHEGGRSYVVRDASVVASARELFEPVRKAMQKQAEMGRQMSESELGASERQTSVDFRESRVMIPDLSAEFQKVEADARRLSAEGGTQSELSELQSELSKLQGRISELQSEASEEKSRADEQRSELNSQMTVANERMQAASAQMKVWSNQGEEATVQAVQNVKAFLDQSIANGAAKQE